MSLTGGFSGCELAEILGCVDLVNAKAVVKYEGCQLCS